MRPTVASVVVVGGRDVLIDMPGKAVHRFGGESVDGVPRLAIRGLNPRTGRGKLMSCTRLL